MKRLHDVAFSVFTSEEPWTKVRVEEKHSDIEDARMEDVSEHILSPSIVDAKVSCDELLTLTFHGGIKRRISFQNEERSDLWRNHLIGAPGGGSSASDYDAECTKVVDDGKRGSLANELLTVLRYLLLEDDDHVNIYHARELLMKYARRLSSSLGPKAVGGPCFLWAHHPRRNVMEWTTAEAFSNLWQVCWEGAQAHNRTPSFKVCSALLDAGANVNTPVSMCSDGDVLQGGASNALCTRTTALHLCPNAELLELLLRARADVTGGSSNGPHGYTPLHCAVKRGAAPLVRLLLQHGAPVNATANASSCVPRLGGVGVSGGLRQAFAGGRSAFGAHTDASLARPMNNNITPLHCAVQLDIIPIIDLLLDAGADVDTQTASGYTALHYAAANGTSPALTQRLLDRRNASTLHLRCCQGLTPLELAQKRLFQCYSPHTEAVVKLITEATLSSTSSGHNAPGSKLDGTACDGENQQAGVSLSSPLCGGWAPAAAAALCHGSTPMTSGGNRGECTKLLSGDGKRAREEQRARFGGSKRPLDKDAPVLHRPSVRTRRSIVWK